MIRKKLIENKFKDAEIAVLYLNQHTQYRGKKRKKVLMDAIYQIVEAYGFARLSKRLGLSRHVFSRGCVQAEKLHLDRFLELLDLFSVQIEFKKK